MVSVWWGDNKLMNEEDINMGASPLDEKKEDFIDAELLEELPLTADLLDEDDNDNEDE